MRFDLPETFTVASSRAEVRLRPDGSIASYRVNDGCLLFASDHVRVTHPAGRAEVTVQWSDTSARVPCDDDDCALFVGATRGWVLLADRSSVRAVNERGAVIRGELTEAAGPRLEPFSWGSSMVIADGASVRVFDEGGATHTLRCGPQQAVGGSAHGAAIVASGELVVATSNDSDTSVCVVSRDARGKPKMQARTPLGHATCGLARAVSCPYDLRFVEGDHVFLNSMRGGLAVVNWRQQKRVSIPAVRGTYQGNGSFFYRCPGGVCVELNASTGDGGMSTFGATFGARGMELEPRAEQPPSPPDNAPPGADWCVRAGLPVPRELCGQE